jgi:nicotinamidase-related amidase
MTSVAALARLDKDRTVIVVVDLQERLLPAIRDRERVLGNARLLLRLAQAASLPVVLTTQYKKGLGELLPEVTALAPSATPIDKVSFGCFGDASFQARLVDLKGRDQLVVSGVESHICVAQTVLGALDNGYRVHVASDAVGSRTEENRQVGLLRMQAAGAVVTSTEMAIYELLSRSDSDAFKKMLPYLKGDTRA